jgi:hypothetical protein
MELTPDTPEEMIPVFVGFKLDITAPSDHNPDIHS